MSESNADLSVVVAELREGAIRCADALRRNPSDNGALVRKRAFDRAIRVLIAADRMGVDGRESCIVVPMGGTQSPSSEFRVIEDHETDKRHHWTELLVDGERLRLYPGDVIVRSKE